MMDENKYIISGGIRVAYKSSERMIGGINSKVYKVKKEQKDAILKFYSEHSSELRQEREVRFYKFMEVVGGNWTPELIEYNKEQKWTLLTFIEGVKIDILTENDR